jgi:apolipoprotein N-acyltransferase
VIICFEAIFPDLSRAFVRKGSELIVSLTNDAWYGDTSAPYQHLAMARWRAVESRRYLLRAANSGISAIIAPSGKIEVETGLLREDAAVGGFSFLRGKTFYVQYGWLFPILCMIISGAALLWSRLRGSGPMGMR